MSIVIEQSQVRRGETRDGLHDEPSMPKRLVLHSAASMSPARGERLRASLFDVASSMNGDIALFEAQTRSTMGAGSGQLASPSIDMPAFHLYAIDEDGRTEAHLSQVTSSAEFADNDSVLFVSQEPVGGAHSKPIDWAVEFAVELASWACLVPPPPATVVHLTVPPAGRPHALDLLAPKERAMTDFHAPQQGATRRIALWASHIAGQGRAEPAAVNAWLGEVVREFSSRWTSAAMRCACCEVAIS